MFSLKIDMQQSKSDKNDEITKKIKTLKMKINEYNFGI